MRGVVDELGILRHVRGLLPAPAALPAWTARRGHGRIVHATKPNPYTTRDRNRRRNRAAAASRRRNR